MPYSAGCWKTVDPRTLLYTSFGIEDGRTGTLAAARWRFIDNELLEPDYGKYHELARRRVPVSTLPATRMASPGVAPATGTCTARSASAPSCAGCSAGESAEQTLIRELGEELGVIPTGLMLLGDVEEVAAIDNAPMRMTVFTTRIAQDPRSAAEPAVLGWTNGAGGYDPQLAAAVSGQVTPLLRRAGRLPG